MSGCASKSEGVGIFGEQAKTDKYSLVLNLKDNADYKIPLCKDGVTVLTKVANYSSGYYPTSVTQESNNTAITTHIYYDKLKSGSSFEIVGCYIDADRDAISLKVENTVSEANMMTRTDETNFDNVVRHFKDSDNYTLEDVKKAQ